MTRLRVCSKVFRAKINLSLATKGFCAKLSLRCIFSLSNLDRLPSEAMTMEEVASEEKM